MVSKRMRKYLSEDQHKRERKPRHFKTLRNLETGKKVHLGIEDKIDGDSIITQGQIFSNTKYSIIAECEHTRKEKLWKNTTKENKEKTLVTHFETSKGEKVEIHTKWGRGFLNSISHTVKYNGNETTLIEIVKEQNHYRKILQDFDYNSKRL